MPNTRPASNPTLNALLTRLGNTIRERCQRQIETHRSSDTLDLPGIVDRVLRDHGAEADFDQQLIACISALCQPDAVGHTWVVVRDNVGLHLRHIDTLDLLGPGIERYEMVLFDAGHRHGGRWKHVFFPAQRIQCFVDDA